MDVNEEEADEEDDEAEPIFPFRYRFDDIDRLADKFEFI